MKCWVVSLILAFSCWMCELKAQTVTSYHPGDVVADVDLKRLGEDSFFFTCPLSDEVFALMQGRSFKANCTLSRDSLRYIQCLHRDAEGRAWVGEMVVNVRIADDCLSIFRELFRQSYPIQRMRLIDYWEADDERSMRDNNSSSFNFRFISHTTKVSVHGRGMAVDINPLYNPYHKSVNGKEIVEPATATPYLDRQASFPYKIVEGDLCVRLFKAHGFEWGGNWKTVKDYQHFEKNN